MLDEAQAIKNPASETAQQLRRIPARTRLALTGTPIENGLGDLWAILDFTNPGLVGTRPAFIAQMSGDGEAALRALNGILVFRRTKSEPEVAAELPDKIDELDHCTMTPEQIGLYQAVLDELVADAAGRRTASRRQGAILAAITALKQICNHPAAYQRRRPAARRALGQAGPAGGDRRVGVRRRRADPRVHPLRRRGAGAWPTTSPRSPARRSPATTAASPAAPATASSPSSSRATGPGALVLSLKAGGTGLNLTAANHVVLYDRWWNPAVEDQARDRAWRIGQTRTVISHRLVCPGTVDERVEEVVAGKRHIAELVLPASSSLADLDADQLRVALGLRDRRAADRRPSRSIVSEPARPRSTSSRRRRPASRRPNEARAPRPEDLWRPARELPEPEPVAPGRRRHRAAPLARRPAPARQPPAGRALPRLGGRAGRGAGHRAGGQRRPPRRAADLLRSRVTGGSCRARRPAG